MATNISKLTIKAPSSKVWDALTKPEMVEQWQYGSVLTTNWQIGTEIRFKSEWEGKSFEQWGTILEVTPNQKLRYNLFAPRPDLEDKPENYFEMEFKLIEHGDNTVLEIIQEDNRPGAQQEVEQGEENPALKMLKELVENTTSN